MPLSEVDLVAVVGASGVAARILMLPVNALNGIDCIMELPGLSCRLLAVASWLSAVGCRLSGAFIHLFSNVNDISWADASDHFWIPWKK